MIFSSRSRARRGLVSAVSPSRPSVARSADVAAGCGSRELADRVDALRVSRPVPVAVDGPDAAGKSVLAGELGAVLRDRGGLVVVSVDDFPRPPEERYARGRDSPEGYYRDAVDHDALLARDPPPTDPGTVVLCEGIFLLRPELRDLWDLSIVVTAPFDTRLRRALARDVPRLGSGPKSNTATARATSPASGSTTPKPTQSSSPISSSRTTTPRRRSFAPAPDGNRSSPRAGLGARPRRSSDRWGRRHRRTRADAPPERLLPGSRPAAPPTPHGRPQTVTPTACPDS